ncbi:MAG: choice-of-anchor B family protein [Flavobacteriales bacterium]
MAVLNRCSLFVVRCSIAASLLLGTSIGLHAQDSLNMSLAGRWYVDTLPATLQYGNVYNATWGYARDGREYGIIGSIPGTHIIDVTDPATLEEVAFIPGAWQGLDVVHREFKTYQDRLYGVTDEGQGSLQIIDLRWLPDSAPVIYDSHALLYRAHTLWIDTTNARLYTWAGSSEAAVYDLSDPDQPVLLNDCEADISWWNTEVGWVHDGYVRDNIAYTNDMDGMHIVDFTNINAPQLIGSLTNYPQPGYNHSGWLHENGWLYVQADETHGTDLKLFDVTIPTSIEFVDTIGVELSQYSIPHNPCFKGDELHVSYYYDGYWLWSVADPFNAQLLGYYDTSLEPHGPSYKGAWGVYPFLPSGHVLVSDMQRGLFVIDISAALALGQELAYQAHYAKVFPNPADDHVSISCKEAITDIVVFDAQGRIESVEPIISGPTAHIVTASLPDGLYIARTTTTDAVLVSRFIKTGRQ